MLGIGYFMLFEACGLAIIFWLLPRVRPVARTWLGLCLGMILQMWLPALCAFLWRFSLAAHAWAILPLALLTGGAYLARDKRERARFSQGEKGLLILLLCVALPLSLLGGYLQWTHVLNPQADGSLHVGQSTYGDLPLHLAIAAGMRDGAFPAEYTILPGALLTYPFLADSYAASFLLMGWSLRGAVVFTGCLMMALTFSGYLILAERIAQRRGVAALAALFFFINGGLGFLYLVDMQGAVLGEYGSNQLQSVSGLWARIRQVLSGWYQTPANHAEFTTYNLRWSNVIVDMMVPQRTTLAGWTQLLPCLYLLYDEVRPENTLRPGVTVLSAPDGPTAVFTRRRIDFRKTLLLGLWAGMLPMVNTHCFLALGLLSLGWMVYDLLRARGQRRPALAFWALYGSLTVLIAAPQLYTWTFRQAVGNKRFVRPLFNWVNGERGMLDGYFWFYIKNIGLPFLLILLSLLEKNEKRRFLASGAFVIYLAAEFLVFQPNVYDNNKLFYVWYMICAILAADYALELLGRLKGLRARPVIAALCAVGCVATGTLSIARECVSDYQMFSAQDVAAAEFVEQTTERDAIFLTGTQHINFVSSLAGRRIVCGPDTWLYYHGFDTSERQTDIRAFYADPVGQAAVLEKYGVSYILLSGNERYSMAVDTAALEREYTRIYASPGDEIVIYAVGEKGE